MGEKEGSLRPLYIYYTYINIYINININSCMCSKVLNTKGIKAKVATLHF